MHALFQPLPPEKGDSPSSGEGSLRGNLGPVRQPSAALHRSDVCSSAPWAPAQAAKIYSAGKWVELCSRSSSSSFAGGRTPARPTESPGSWPVNVLHAFRTCDTNCPSNSRRMHQRRKEANNSNLLFAMLVLFY